MTASPRCCFAGHWCTNGIDTKHVRTGAALVGPTDPREHAALRLQAWLADAADLRAFFGPTGIYRQYYERIPEDPTQPIDESAWEAHVCALAVAAIARVQAPPFAPHVQEAIQATARLRQTVDDFVSDYRPIEDGDELTHMDRLSKTEATVSFGTGRSRIARYPSALWRIAHAYPPHPGAHNRRMC